MICRALCWDLERHIPSVPRLLSKCQSAGLDWRPRSRMVADVARSSSLKDAPDALAKRHELVRDI